MRNATLVYEAYVQIRAEVTLVKSVCLLSQFYIIIFQIYDVGRRVLNS